MTEQELNAARDKRAEISATIVGHVATLLDAGAFPPHAERRLRELCDAWDRTLDLWATQENRDAVETALRG